LNRISRKDLDGLLSNLNEASNRKYNFDCAYGGIKLVVEEGRGISDMSRRLTTTEMYEALYTMQNWRYKEGKEPL